jgi:hypothetical protein
MVPQSRSPAFLGFLNVSEKSMYSVVTYPETSLGRFMEPLNDGRATSEIKFNMRNAKRSFDCDTRHQMLRG